MYSEYTCQTHLNMDYNLQHVNQKTSAKITLCKDFLKRRKDFV